METMKDHQIALPVYLDPRQDLSLRVADLVSRMTLEEKIAQLFYDAPAIARLGVPAYNWWNEALHGVARAGIATVFPQAIGLAATFNTDRIHHVAIVIAEEMRAKYHEYVRHDDRGIYKGLTAWSPNINILRDPRWGRGHETYGEDPFLTSRMGVAFVTGLQGDHPQYLKVVATPKHFVAHSGPEKGRESFNAVVSTKDLRETYLPAFRACVVEAKAMSVMSAYNRLNGEPCSASPALLRDILRDEWGFSGYVVSDCGAAGNIYEHHRSTASYAESMALSITHGCDLHCDTLAPYLQEAVESDLISEQTVTEAVKRAFTARFRLGMFDPDNLVPYAHIPYKVNDCSEHRALARTVVRESVVLLKNAGHILPLCHSTLNAIAVIGPNADDREVLLGSYHGTPSRTSTILDGIRSAVEPQTQVYYAKGCALLMGDGNYAAIGDGTYGFSEAVSTAERADVTIVCLGLSAQLEGENGDAYNSDAAGDRTDLGLPSVQQALLECLYTTGTPIVLVLLNGGGLSIPWAHEHVPAILETWYPGAEAGHGVADILFGHASPCGRLPMTVVQSVDDLPPFHDYSMKNRTYRFIERKPLYPFGYGLSYTTFAYSNLHMSRSLLPAGEPVTVSVCVTNTGEMAATEIVQCYLEDVEVSVVTPQWQLKGMHPVALLPGESAEIAFTLSVGDMEIVDEAGGTTLELGEFRVYVGGYQPDDRSRELTGVVVASASFVVIESSPY